MHCKLFTDHSNMTKDEQGRRRKRGRVGLALAALAVILAVLIVPPFLSVSHYTSRITSLVAASLGRPVRLSSVRVRLLPTPGFVLYDLTVEEDPKFGAEPLLRANTVTASIRLLSLWRGRLEISKVSVDEASLNLVHMPGGSWNLDPLLRTAATKAGSNDGASHVPPFPYIVATNSRVNFKNGVEKLPFSLVETDLSFWQQEPGVWRLRLRGQPARTDVSLDLADTGVVELNATAHRAPELRQMPIHLDMDWRDAQLGQLTRLGTGSDAGWRGDLRGELHLDGTAASAQVQARLRATGVHRAEFEPAAAMDFDANCGFVYHYSERTVEKLVCDSPLGDGHVRLEGDLPGGTVQPHFSVELDRIPVAAGLDALRTVRSGISPDLQASGTASGKIVYSESPVAGNVAAGRVDEKPVRAMAAHPAKTQAKAAGTKAAAPPPASLTGSFTVDGLRLSGGGLSRPVLAPKMVLEPAEPVQGRAQMLAGTVAVPLGGATPLTVNLRLGLKGYQAALKGQVSIARSRELAHAAGLTQTSAFDSLAGEPLTLDLNAEGPWMPAEATAFSTVPVAGIAKLATPATPGAELDNIPASDTLSGTVTLHNANWNANYLANHVEISEATLHLDLAGGVGESRWDPVDFVYGPLKGRASLAVPPACDVPETCPTQFQVQFGELDAATVQTTILGAREKGTLLSDLINRLRPSAAPVWPRLRGTIKADSLVLGPVTLKNAAVELRFRPSGAEITGFDATLLGGTVHGAGTLTTGNKPAYALTANFDKLNPVAVGQLLGGNWRGGTIAANGKVELSGYTGSDLSDSAKGTLHFEWRRGVVGGAFSPQLTRFDHWTADAVIANGKISLGTNQVVQGSHKRSLDAAVTLAETPRVTFAAPKPELAKKR